MEIEENTEEIYVECMDLTSEEDKEYLKRCSFQINCLDEENGDFIMFGG